MLRRILCPLVALILPLLITTGTYAQTPVNDLAGLEAMTDTGHYIIVADIDASGYNADIRNFDRSAKWPFHGQTDSRYDNWHDKVLSETKRSKETFVLHFEATYAEYPELPLWAVAELCSFGSLSMMYSFMQKPDMNAIAAQYKLQSVFLESWLHTFSYLRNLCAHHARLWDKRMSIRPKVPVGKAWEAVRHNPSNVFFAALMVNWMLSHDSFDPDFHAKWKREIEGIADRLHGRFPQFRAITGFSDGWKRNPIWSL